MSYELKKPYNINLRIRFIDYFYGTLGLRTEETEYFLFALEANEMMGKKEVEIEGEMKLVDYPVINPNYEQEQAEKEHERIQALSMTRSDFFDGTIKAFGADEDDLLTAIQIVLEDIPISDLEKKIAINNYKNALNFYRKHPLFTLLADVPIPLGESVTIVITAEQWDRFFDLTDQKNPDAYKELLPKATINNEPVETEVEEELPEED